MKNFQVFDPIDIYMDPPVEESPYEVLIITTFYENGEAFKIIRFKADYNALGTLLPIVAKRSVVFPKLHKHLFDLLAQKVRDENSTTQDLCPLIVKCICCWAIAAETLSKYPPESIGFKLDVEMDRLMKSRLWGATKQEVEEAFNKLISNNKEN